MKSKNKSRFGVGAGAIAAFLFFICVCALLPGVAEAQTSCEANTSSECGGGGTSGLTSGTTTVAGGTDKRCLFDDNGVLGEDAGCTYTKATDIMTLVGGVDIGATDTTITRVGAGVAAVEGATIATLSTVQTWTAIQSMTSASSLQLADGASVSFPNTGGTQFQRRTQKTPDAFTIETDTTANSVHINEGGDWNFDFQNGHCGTSACSSPTISVHSTNQSTSQWLDLYHDGTNGTIYGKGGLLLYSDATLSLWGGTAEVARVTSSGLDVGLKPVLFGTLGSADVGLARAASANVLKVTDGSTGIRGLLGGGGAVASATAMPVPTGNVFHVTGTTAITSITSTNFQAGTVITLIFDGVLNFTDGSNLKLASTFATTADDTITLVYDGTNWYETARSIN